MGGIRHRRQRHRPPRRPDDAARRSGGEPGRPRGAGYDDIVKENAKFEAFYRRQGVCADEAELQKMMATLRRDLPASFRVTGFRSQALAIRNIIESKYFKELSAVDAIQEVGEGGKEKATRAKVQPKCLSWYPDRMAWQLNLTRRDIRRVEAYFKLHNFLISETESGNISRQESVSMIPPLILDVQPYHKVLDMCAAPGSKTAQLIEAIHKNEESLSPGMVVANDCDNSRCYMLVHQARRLQSPNFIITNSDASIMPNLNVTESNTGETKSLKFDRVLCDVPCSGDGTLRKNADIWPKWNAANSCNLHGIQYRIAKRGLELLDVGGRLVYSTCSLNPLEDEAVIHRLLREAGPAVELVDASPLVPGLLYNPGLESWVVAAKDNTFYESFESVPEVYHSLIRPTMFPPAEAERGTYNLSRCMRILPHQQDTGGFFVAALVKNGPCAWESKKVQEERVAKETEKDSIDKNGAAEAAEGDTPPAKKTRRERREDKPKKVPQTMRGYNEDPFVYLDEEEEDGAFAEIKEYFGLETLRQGVFFTRCADRTKRNNFYFSSPLVRNVVENNVGRVKIINTGIKAFTKCENKGTTCAYRLAQEGSQMTIPFLGTSRLVHPTLADLRNLLVVNDAEAPPPLTDMDENTRTRLEELPTGSIGLVYEGDSEDGIRIKLQLVGWKGKASVRAYVPKNERIHYLRLVGGDTSKYEKNKFEEKRKLEEEKSRQEESVKRGGDTLDVKEDDDPPNVKKEGDDVLDVRKKRDDVLHVRKEDNDVLDVKKEDDVLDVKKEDDSKSSYRTAHE